MRIYVLESFPLRMLEMMTKEGVNPEPEEGISPHVSDVIKVDGVQVVNTSDIVIKNHVTFIDVFLCDFCVVASEQGKRSQEIPS